MRPSNPITALAAAVALAGALAGCVAAPVAGGGALLTRAVFQERGLGDALTDTQIAFGIEYRLAERSGELFGDVSVDVTEGEVVLTGSVPQDADRVAALRAAWDTPGVETVVDAMTVARDAGTAQYFEDIRIANSVRYALITDTKVRKINVTVTVVDAVVHLTGIARSEAELERIVGHARTVPGVGKVVSHLLTIADPRRVRRIAKAG